MQEVTEVLRKLTGRQLVQLQAQISELYNAQVGGAYARALKQLSEVDINATVSFTVEENSTVPVIEVQAPNWESACHTITTITVPLEYSGVRVDLGTDYLEGNIQICLAIHHFPKEMEWVKKHADYPHVSLRTILDGKEEETTKGENTDDERTED